MKFALHALVPACPGLQGLRRPGDAGETWEEGEAGRDLMRGDRGCVDRRCLPVLAGCANTAPACPWLLHAPNGPPTPVLQAPAGRYPLCYPLCVSLPVSPQKTGTVLRSMDRGISSANTVVEMLFLRLVPTCIELVVLCIIFITSVRS